MTRTEPELVPHDDAVIGRAFRLSIAVVAAIAAIAVIAGAVAWWVNRDDAGDTAVAGSGDVVPPPVVPTARTPALPFTDVTARAGLDFVHVNGATGEKLLPETMGAGAAFLDFDDDGDQDLLLVNARPWPWSQPPDAAAVPTPKLYRNDGTGRFEDVTAGSGLDVSMYGMGVAVGDIDGDGAVDIYVTAVGPNRLFRNLGGGRFEDVTATAGVAGGDGQWSTSAGFFDADGDGRLDLFVCNYVAWSREVDAALAFTLDGTNRAYGPPRNFEGDHCALYLNDGAGPGGVVRFRDVSAAAGLHVTNPSTGVPVGKALALAPIDIDRDGDIDVIVANDTTRNFLFENAGDGTFAETGTLRGVAFSRMGAATGAMGIDAAHHRNDDDLAVAIGNFANEMSSCYVRPGSSSQFSDDAIIEGIGSPSRIVLSFGLFFFDADLDGRLDLLQSNGHLEEDINQVQVSQHYRQRAQLFWNAGPAAPTTFVEVPADTTGDLAEPIVGRAAAFADIDGDGDLDVLLTQVAGRPLLLRNDADHPHHWLRVRLIDDRGPGNRHAIGAWIDLTAAGRTQRRQVMPTRSYLSQVELPVTFGLGGTGAVDGLTVHWPDGTRLEVAPDDVGDVDREIVVRRR